MKTDVNPMTVILANGQFPQHPVPLEILRRADKVICCDGAALKLMSSGIRMPDAVIGDLDSLPQSARADLSACLIHVSEQETNDLNKAFRYCLEQGLPDTVILGAAGLREDHTIGNVSLLSDFSESCPGIRMVTDFGTFYPFTGVRHFTSFPGQEISIFSFSAEERFYSEGLQYPLDGLVLTRWWQATLNRATGTTVTLRLEGTGPAAIAYFTHHPQV